MEHPKDTSRNCQNEWTRNPVLLNDIANSNYSFINSSFKHDDLMKMNLLGYTYKIYNSGYNAEIIN